MITLKGICRRYLLGNQEVHALRDINLHIGRGEYVAVMGPSGSGKSTLLNQIALLDRPDAGAYMLDDQDVTHLSDDDQARIRRERIGFVFQFFHLVQRLSAAENVELPLVLAGIHPRERRSRVAEAVAAFGLGERSGHRPDQLSGGERQRVAIARSTIMNPDLVLADEPTGNLDQATGRQVIQLLEKLYQGGVTLILITHDPAIGSRAKRLIRLIDGRISHDSEGAQT